MDNDILKALSNLLDEKLKPITQELNNINKKLDGITEQTADLVEFRSEMIKHFSFEHEYIRKYIIKRRMKKDLLTIYAH